MIKNIISVLASLALFASQAFAGYLINPHRQSTIGPATFNGCTANDTDTNVYTFPSVAISSASANRLVVIAVGGEDSTATFDIDEVTINSIPVTAYQNLTIGTLTSQLGSLAVASGTTATVQVTFSENVTSAVVCTWAAYDIDSIDRGTVVGVTTDGTAFSDTYQIGGVDQSLQLNDRYFAICVSDAGNTHIWTQAIENIDGGGSAEFVLSAAQDYVVVAGTITITCDPSGAGTSIMNGAAYR